MWRSVTLLLSTLTDVLRGDPSAATCVVLFSRFSFHSRSFFFSLVCFIRIVSVICLRHSNLDEHCDPLRRL